MDKNKQNTQRMSESKKKKKKFEETGTIRTPLQEYRET